MIIGETFKNDYDGYGEENYDYLFKRKSNPARQQKKADKKEKHAVKKQGRQLKRQDKKSGIAPKKRLIQGNFGMFNKNKRREEAAALAEAPDSSEADNTALPNEEANQTPETATPVENANVSESGNENAGTLATPSEDSNSNESEYDEYDEYEYDESGYDEPTDKTKTEAKSETKDSKAKDKGFGSAFGFLFLGFTIAVVGFALYSSEKKSKEILAPFKHTS